MATIKWSLKGLKAIQAANMRHMAALQPGGMVEGVHKEMSLRAFRWVVTATHVDTGTLRASRNLHINGLQSVIFSQDGVNPKNKKNPREYDFHEQARAGSHATYPRFLLEQQYALGRWAIVEMIRRLD